MLFAILLFNGIVVLNVTVLITATIVVAEPSSPALISQIPLVEGLTIVAAHHDPAGDFEPITTVTKIDERTVTVTVSTDQPSRCMEQSEFGSRRTVSRRSVLRDDLERAHAYRQEFTACALKPELNPGITAIGLSASALRELKADGQTKLRATTRVAGMVPGILTRIEHESVPFKLIVNDEQVELAVIHARWHSPVGDREYWILDDVSNPLMLRGSYNGNAFLEVVKLSFPTGETAARLERDLSKHGRTVVYGIYFDFASDRIKEESEPVLKEIADVMTKNPTWGLAVEGHTDSIGDKETNLVLSQRRAAAVRKTLGDRYKIAPTRLEPTGFGETQPKATNETLQGRALNRRVELVRIDP